MICQLSFSRAFLTTDIYLSCYFYIAYNTNRIIAHSENLREVLELAKAAKQTFLIYLFPCHTASMKVLPIRFHTVFRGD